MTNKENIRERILGLSQGKPVALFGAGISAVCAKSLLDTLSIESVFYAEGEGKHAEKSVDFKPFTAADADKHSLVVYSPAFRPDSEWIEWAQSHNATAICETDLSALAWSGKVIAITGTNGKTTLTSFIAHALNKNGLKAVAAGNIGKPLCGFCAELEDTSDMFAVYELSSFQTSRIKFLRPDALAWTNFAPDHLDWHKSMEEYFDAKLNLANNLRSEIFFAGESVASYAKKYSRTLPDFTKIVSEHNSADAPKPFDSPIQAQNYAMARALLGQFRIKESDLEKSAADFKLPAYRFTTAIQIDGIKFYNDSKATNAHAAIAALKSLNGTKNLVWLGGGKDKYCDIDELVKAVKNYAIGAVLIGQTAQKLKDALKEMPLGISICETMEDAVKECAKMAKNEGSVLFSPAFSSFGMFSGYADRGKSFDNAVLCLKNLK